MISFKKFCCTNLSKIKQAQLDIESLDHDIENTKQSLDLDYKNAITNIENSLISLQSMKENVILAEKVQKNTQANDQYGLATLTELLDAENALTEAKQNHATALYSINTVANLKNQDWDIKRTLEHCEKLDFTDGVLLNHGFAQVEAGSWSIRVFNKILDILPPNSAP